MEIETIAAIQGIILAAVGGLAIMQYRTHRCLGKLEGYVIGLHDKEV